MTRGSDRDGPPTLHVFLTVSLWFGIVTGVLEGAGLLVFQRLNWERWGMLLHVSSQILLISTVVDVCLFMGVSLAVGVPRRLGLRFPALRMTVFLLVFLTIYDWVTLTGRLRRSSCLILALGVAVAFGRWFGKRQDKVVQFWKLTTPWLLAALLFIGAGIEGGGWLRERQAVARLPEAAPEAPNVLVIVVDTLRADHLSSYGYPRSTSPNFDRIAAEGVLFENAISATSWSFPSHVSLLTGRYQFEHGLGDVPKPPLVGLPRLGGFPTLGERLEQRGYRTGAFSANRIFFSRDLGMGRGFIHFEDYFHSAADMFVRTSYGKEFARMYLLRSEKSKVIRLLRWLKFDALLDQDAEGSGSYGGAFGIRKRAPVVNGELLRWIDRDRRRPFFAFLNYFDVHSPYKTPRSYPDPAWYQGPLVDQYDRGVKYADDGLGELMRGLESRGLLQNTLVVVTADHGESLGEHGLTTHGGVLYWDEIHVPLIFWYPKGIPKGLRVARPVSNVDLAASVLDVLGFPSGEIPGESLTAFWKTGQAPAVWPDPLSELAKREYPGKDNKTLALPTSYSGALESVITPRWHFITHQKFGNQLYDWTRDPEETDDLLNTPEGRDPAQTLSAELRARLAAGTRR